MAKKKKQESYHVEVITKARVYRGGGSWEYRVKWAAWDSDADSWEPEDNLRHCDRLLEAFWNHVGIDDNDYPPDYEVSATEEWIEKEQLFFRENYPEELAEARRQRERADREKQRDQEKQEKREQRQREKEQEKRGNFKMHKFAMAKLPPTSGGASSKRKGKIQTIVISSSSSNKSDEESPSVSSVPAKRKAEALPPILIPPRKIFKADDVLPSNYSTSPVIIKHTSALDNLSPRSGPYPQDKGKQKEENPGEQKTRESSPDSLFSDSSLPETLTKAGRPPNQLSKTGSTSKVAIQPRKKKREPRVKFIELENLTGGSSLSTKQKVAQRALAIVTPNVPVSKKQIPDIHFKKYTSVPDPNIVEASEDDRPPQPEPVLVPDDLSTQTDIPAIESIAVDAPASCPSPMEYIPLADYDEPDLFESVVSPPEAELTDIATYDDIDGRVSPVLRTSALPAVVGEDAVAEADAFLKEIVSTELANQVDELPSTVQVAEVISLPNITKKWNWTGELFIETEQDKVERLCEIVLTDATDHIAEGLRLDILFSETKSIRFQQLSDVYSIDLVLRACKASEQVARMASSNEEDAAVLKSLASYMSFNKQVTFTPIFSNDYHVAMLLTFPPSMADFCDRFNVPDDLRNSTLVSTLMPLLITSKQKELEWRRDSDISTKPVHQAHAIITAEQRKDVLRFNRRCSRGLRTLDFPKSLNDFLSSSSRTYYIWSSRGDGNGTAYGTETDWLMAILDHSGAKNVGSKGDARVVFVHVGAMKYLSGMPSLAERRSKQPHVQFFTYGTHETVVPLRWKIREIFPLGGIVTFTPRAIVEDPSGVNELVKQIAQHPFWNCYILPAVIGMVFKIVHGDNDPPTVFDSSGEPGCDLLLDRIEDGSISLLQSPPLARNPRNENDPAFAWVETQTMIPIMQTRAILEHCVKSCRDLYSNVQEPEWNTVIEQDIMEELIRMQMQPEIMDEYRRFVVIRASSEDRVGEYRGGFEWVTTSLFGFNDDYYTAEERERAR